MQFIDDAIAALKDFLVGGMATSDAIELVSIEYDVREEPLRRLFERRYNNTPEEMARIRIQPPKGELTFGQRANAAKEAAQSYSSRCKMPRWQQEAAGTFLRIKGELYTFAAYYAEDKYPLKVFHVETGKQDNWRGMDDWVDRLQRKFEQDEEN